MEYVDIGGGYRFARLRVGAAVMAPDGREVYFQPGDDTAAICATIDALDEVKDGKRAIIAAMVLGEYFD